MPKRNVEPTSIDYRARARAAVAGEDQARRLAALIVDDVRSDEADVDAVADKAADNVAADVEEKLAKVLGVDTSGNETLLASLGVGHETFANPLGGTYTLPELIEKAVAERFEAVEKRLDQILAILKPQPVDGSDGFNI